MFAAFLSVPTPSKSQMLLKLHISLKTLRPTLPFCPSAVQHRPLEAVQRLNGDEVVRKANGYPNLPPTTRQEFLPSKNLTKKGLPNISTSSEKLLPSPRHTRNIPLIKEALLKPILLNSSTQKSDLPRDMSSLRAEHSVGESFCPTEEVQLLSPQSPQPLAEVWSFASLQLPPEQQHIRISSECKIHFCISSTTGPNRMMCLG